MAGSRSVQVKELIDEGLASSEGEQVLDQLFTSFNRAFACADRSSNPIFTCPSFCDPKVPLQDLKAVLPRKSCATPVVSCPSASNL